MRRLWPLALTLACGACVTLNEPVLAPQSIAKGQRTILLVYAAPGPWVITDSESKAEAAAKMLPGLSYAVQSFQDDRYKAAAETLQKYVPPWGVKSLVEEALLKELPKTRFPGSFVPVAEASADTAALRGWNRASDTLDWQNRYLYPDPLAPHPRDYARFLPWDDALVFEVNVLPLVAADDDGNMIPTLSAASRLVRCQTLHLLWKHEDKADDPGNARSLYEFETLPQQLIDRWKALVPALASKISGSLYASLNPGAAPLSGPAGVPLSSGTLPGMMTPQPSTGTFAGGFRTAFSTGTVSLAVSSQTVTTPAPPTVSSETVSGAAVPAVSSPTAPAPGPP
jgi:hypothetical protein